MKSFFGQWWHGSRTMPPKIVEKAFFDRFPEPLNPEWYISGDTFEVIFYENEVEKIARYNKEGVLSEWQENISPSTLPLAVLENAGGMGEIMNAIIIHTEEKNFYELIVRDNRLDRFSLHFTGEGILEKRKPL